jgi:hypothetical protein
MTVTVGQYGEKSVSYGPEAAQRRRMQKLVEDNAWEGHQSGRCDHCGHQGIRYRAVLRHLPTGKVIEAGETCLENRFSVATEDFKAMKKHAEEMRAEQRIKKAKDAFVEANPDLAWLREDPIPEEYRGSDYLWDVARKFRTYGELSDRQIAAVRRVAAKEVEFHARKRQQDAEKAAQEAARPHAPVPTGRVEITGEVWKVKDPEPYDRFPSTKMLVADDRGFRVWGSVPASLSSVQRGDRVSFTAEVEASKDDPEFGFYRRPTQGRRVATPAPQPEPVAQYDEDDRSFDAWAAAGGLIFPPQPTTYSPDPVQRLRLAVSEAAKALAQKQETDDDDEDAWQAYRSAKRALREAEADTATT